MRKDLAESPDCTQAALAVAYSQANPVKDHSLGHCNEAKLKRIMSAASVSSVCCRYHAPGSSAGSHLSSLGASIRASRTCSPAGSGNKVAVSGRTRSFGREKSSPVVRCKSSR